MGAVTYLIRTLPLTLIRKEIKSPLIKSFLFYVPYVTLAVMTFPAIINSTGSVISGGTDCRSTCCMVWKKSFTGVHTLLYYSICN